LNAWRKHEALELIDQAIAAGYHNLDWIVRAPDLACLHGEAEFRRLLEKAGSAQAAP
jgi:hypothetical protein